MMGIEHMAKLATKDEERHTATVGKVRIIVWVFIAWSFAVGVIVGAALR